MATQSLRSSTALARILPYYVLQLISKSASLPHLQLNEYQIFTFHLQRRLLSVVVYEVVDVRTGQGFGWEATAADAANRAFFGGAMKA